jgi:hypothetical protein
MLSFFAILPLITVLNFSLTHCSKLRCNWFNKNFGSKFFFGAVLMMFVLFSLPFGMTAVLEIRTLDKSNEY